MSASESFVVGHGGGGKSGSGGGISDTPDTIRSRAYARVVDLISEGEIEGLVDGAKSIYLNQTPLQNSDDSYNFSGLAIAYRGGTAGQSYVPGFAAVENEIGVGVEVLNGTPLIRTITDADIDAARITLEFPQLVLTSDDGSIIGTDCHYTIELQGNGGGYVVAIDNTVRGKSTSKYQISHRIELVGDPPWDIRVTRVSDDYTSLNQNRSYWTSYTEIVDGKFTYPNSALVALSVDSSQFQSVPTRGYRMRGRRIQVPSNYNPTTRVYSGVWDGTFQIAYSNNPAWVLYDLVSIERYGLGQYVELSWIDKWALYSIAQYCDELVPDGFGGTEPRFTCNSYLQVREEAFTSLAKIASGFRSMTSWATGAIYTSQDAPAEPVSIYTPANVIGGMFNYQGASTKARHTVALVTWNDPDNFYKKAVEYVPDDAAIAQYGIVEVEVVAVGCTSRGQAHRYGQMILDTEQNSSETVTFQTGLSGAIARPGDVIRIADPLKSGQRNGGRIAAVNGSSITLDAPVTLVTGETYTFWTIDGDGNLKSAEIQNPGGEIEQVTLLADIAPAPQVGLVWVIEGGPIAESLWRVVTVSEATPGKYEVTALAHDPTKYNRVESGLSLSERSGSTITATPAAPQNVTLTTATYYSGGARYVQVTISWDPVPFAAVYVITYRVENSNPITVESKEPTIEVPLAAYGNWVISVFARNMAGGPGPASPLTQLVVAPAPADVTGFTGSVGGPDINLSWDMPLDISVQYGGRVHINFQATTSGATWAASSQVANLPGNQTSATLIAHTGTYLIKAIASSGAESVNAATYVNP